MDLRPVDQGALPPGLRSATPEARGVYRQALGFEALLLRQITQSLLASAQADDEGSGDAALDQLRQMLPQTMADAVAGAGGLGLAAELTRAIAAGPTAPRNGGTDR